MNAEVADRFAGCLLGLAMGATIGAGYAGVAGTDVLYEYLEDGRTPGRSGLAESTDDAALAMATARAIVGAGRVEGSHLARAYLEWFCSGGGSIGQSTWLALRRLQRGVPWTESGDTGRFAAGGAPAARIAPVGLLHAYAEAGMREDVRTCGMITHRNEEALAGALAVAHIVARAARGALRPEQACAELQAMLPSCRCRDALYRAQATWEAGIAPVTAIRGLGEGASVCEAVGTALYCCLASQWQPERAILMAALAPGDGGTRAAIAGALAGARSGKQALSTELAAQLWEAPLIEQAANRLLKLALAAGGEATFLPSVRAPA